jgi:aromatic ring-opening dioxygenase catalytic subunit (LigB family)
MSSDRFPALFLSHGGGPWPYIDEMKDAYALSARQFGAIPQQLPARPAAVLVVSAHWERPGFTVSSGAHPPMLYDYGGFPEHTYHVRYPAPGQPELAAQVQQLLAGAGIEAGLDPQRGFDHGTFVPLGLIYPQADVPVVMLSLKHGLDPQEHIRVGQALAPLREQGVLIIGSGLSYHNMRGFGQPSSMALSESFEHYLFDAVSDSDPVRRQGKLVQWDSAPHARQVHPREEHLLPLMVLAGAAGSDPGSRLFIDRVMGVAMANYRFG